MEKAAEELQNFLNAEVATAVVVRNLKGTTKTHDTSVTTLRELLTESIHKLSFSHVHGWSVIFSSSTTAGTTTRGSGAARATTGSATSGTTVTALLFFALPALLLVDVHGAVEVPGVVHHEGKVVISIDGGRHVVVVFSPLVLGDDVVGSLGVAHGVSSLESFEELGEDLLFSFLARHNIGMLVGLVDTTDVVDIDHATAVSVHLVESFHDNSLTGLVHGSTDGAEELVVLKETTAIVIHVCEKDLNLTLGEAEHVVRHGLAEFELVERHRVVVVHNTELLGKANDTTGTTGLQFVAKSLEEVVATGAALGGGTTDISLEDFTGEFSVVKSATAILVVKVVKSVQILRITINKN